MARRANRLPGGCTISTPPQSHPEPAFDVSRSNKSTELVSVPGSNGPAYALPQTSLPRTTVNDLLYAHVVTVVTALGEQTVPRGKMRLVRVHASSTHVLTCSVEYTRVETSHIYVPCDRFADLVSAAKAPISLGCSPSSACATGCL